MASVSSILTEMNTQTALQQARDAEAARQASMTGDGRNVGGTMGKTDFLMLLSAQLRFQDPLNPTSDADFAAQLAQFSSLEQMQNMNETLSAMASYQAYNLVGKFVVAQAFVDNIFTEIPGIVDSIFTRKGVTYAQIGEYPVPISSITDVFDSSVLLTPQSLMQASNSLIGRTIKAQVDDKIYEGTVTRITVDKGAMYALIDDGTDTPKYVLVDLIFDIRQAGTPGTITPPEEEPEDSQTLLPIVPEGHLLIADGDDYIETNAEGAELGRWRWNFDEADWVFTATP